MKGNFNKLINGDQLVLVDFHAEWCGPCKMLAPINKQLLKIDVEKNQAIAQRFEVRGVPTLVLFKNGKVVWKESGLRTKQQIINVIDQNL